MNKLPRDRRRKVLERVVNPLLIKYMTSNPADVCIAANIPIKYLPYFKEVSASRRAKRIRYRYRGTSKPGYKRPQSFCHMNHADTFAIYYR